MPKFYAVKTGKIPGIYTSWDECKNQINGFKGAVFKSFTSEAEAKNFIGVSKNSTIKERISVFTDGSFFPEHKTAGCATVIPSENKVYYAAVAGASNNVGELTGIMLALQFTTAPLEIFTDSRYSINVLSNNYSAKENVQLISNIKKLLENRDVIFTYVPAHTGVFYNEIADEYAKRGCSLSPGDIEFGTLRPFGI